MENTTQKIKLIWDFRGAVAFETAERHHEHLNEFLEAKNIENISTGFEQLTDFHSVTYLIVPQEQMIFFRDALKPHRGELV